MRAAAAGAMAASGNSFLKAQTLSRTLRIIVGFPAGGGTDVLARILAEKLTGGFASAAIVENRPGGAARISVEYVRKSRDDGRVILFTAAFPLTVHSHSVLAF